MQNMQCRQPAAFLTPVFYIVVDKQRVVQELYRNCSS